MMKLILRWKSKGWLNKGKLRKPLTKQIAADLFNPPLCNPHPVKGISGVEIFCDDTYQKISWKTTKNNAKIVYDFLYNEITKCEGEVYELEVNLKEIKVEDLKTCMLIDADLTVSYKIREDYVYEALKIENHYCISPWLPDTWYLF